MKRKKIILVDMDGVLCDYEKALLEQAKEKLGLTPISKNIVFNTELNFETKHQTSIDDLTHEEGFFENLKPFPGAIEAIKEMDKDPDVELFICSAPKKKSIFCHSEKFKWLMKYCGQKIAQKLVLTRDKTLVYGDFLIDDRFEVTGSVEKPSWVHVLFDQPHNSHIKNKPRIYSWEKNWKKVLDLN